VNQQPLIDQSGFTDEDITAKQGLKHTCTISGFRRSAKEILLFGVNS
jgi:hypothetical protein